MERRHFAGLFLSLVLALAILGVLYLLRSHPANAFKKTLSRVGADRTKLDTYYTNDYIDSVRNGFNRFAAYHNDDTILFRKISQLHDDELFFYAWVLVVNNQVAWPKIYSCEKQMVVIEYTIMSMPNFNITINAKAVDDILVFQHISNVDKLLSSHPDQVKKTLAKKVNEY